VRSSSSPRAWRWLFLLAVLYAGLNAGKPLHIDDAAYAHFAHQFVQQPLDPYGFAMLWYDQPERANDILAPPVLPATWAISILLLGEQPWAWKLLLLPWCVLLAFAMHSLFRRFAPAWAMPLTWATILSPAVLPSLNLMLDIPALALALASVQLFLHACDRDSHGLAILAGLTAGFAMETKYTGFLAPGVMLLAAETRRRWALWPGAACAALQTFVVWELLTAMLYGRSHFLNALDGADDPLTKLLLLAPFLGQLGGIAPALIIFALAALGVRWRGLLAATGVALLGYALVLSFEGRSESEAAVALLPFGPDIAIPESYQIAQTIFFLFGVGGAVVLGFVARRLWTTQTEPDARRDTLFLFLWLGLEMAGYLALSPFPAVRRVLGIVVVTTLLVGRLASRTCEQPENRRTVGIVLAGGVALGLAFFALDLREATAQREAVEKAAAWIADHGGGRVWYVGHWGFQFHAERAGMLPVITEYKPDAGSIPLPPSSRLQENDWLIVPDGRIIQQSLERDPGLLREENLMVIADSIPLRTVMCYYGGFAAVEHHDGNRVEVTIYRVTADFTPRRKRDD
jgi:hypothetical protein